jgi:uracil-DNA glycosylase
MNLFGPTPHSALELLPARHDLNSLREAARQCRGCDLYREATQVVFGEGRSHAAILLVGEQPGDREDQQGKPFVGPAGQLLDKCLDSAGVDRTEVYVTNAGPVTATIHPSAILRMPEPAAKDAEIASLIQDLKVAAEYATARRAV